MKEAHQQGPPLLLPVTGRVGLCGVEQALVVLQSNLASHQQSSPQDAPQPACRHRMRWRHGRTHTHTHTFTIKKGSGSM